MRRLLPPLLLLFLLALPFRAALDVDFLQDDFNVRHVFGLGPRLEGGPEVWRRLFHPPPDETDTRFRPLTYLLLYAELRFFGLNPWLLHLGSLLQHLLTALLLWALARRLFPALPAAAWVGALFYGLQPAHADSVGWLAARADPTAGLFTVAALLQWLAYRLRGGGGRFLAALLLNGAALLAKEVAVVLPGLVLLLPGGARRRTAGSLAGAAFLSGAYLLYRWHLFGTPLGTYGDRPARLAHLPWGELPGALLRFVAPAADPAHRTLLLLAPALILLLGLLAAGRGALPFMTRLLPALALFFLPLLPFLDRVHGRHFYAPLLAWALLLAPAWACARRRFPAPALLALLLYVPALAWGVRRNLEAYVEAGWISRAVRRDLGRLAARHPEVRRFVLLDLPPLWRKAPLFAAGLPALAEPPFQARPIPVEVHSAPGPKDLRWVAYRVEKPALLLRLRLPPAAPGLCPAGPLLRELPPRRADPRYRLLSPPPGAAVPLTPALPFRFAVPAAPWPRPLRLVFRFRGGAAAPLLLRPRHLQLLEKTREERILLWTPGRGHAGGGSLLSPPLDRSVRLRWWVEEADLGLPVLRATPASRARTLRLLSQRGKNK